MTGKGHDWIIIAGPPMSEPLAEFPRQWKCSRCGRSTWWTSRPAKVSFISYQGLGCDESLVAGVQES